MMKLCSCIVFLPLLFSCSTFHVDRNLRQSKPGAVQESEDSEDEGPESETVFVEISRPYYVPAGEYVQPDTLSGVPAVRNSNASGIVMPSEYSRAATVYDYHPDWVYEVYTQPLRAVDIILEPGERAVEAPFISDSERWLLGAGVSYSASVPVQHIYVKPAEFSLEASLIINTDRRVYHVILRSYRDVHMPMVRWRYFSTGMPNNFIPLPGSDSLDPSDLAGIDPRFLSFNYKITYGLKRPVWMPELVFDDGQKTYITFPELVLQREMPAIFENRKDVLNYRVAGNILIIDKLIETLTVKIERSEIVISKKRG